MTFSTLPAAGSKLNCVFSKISITEGTAQYTERSFDNQGGETFERAHSYIVDIIV